jgi:hypothetical protein
MPFKQRLLLKSVEMGRELMAAGGNEHLAYNHVLSLADLARALDKGGHPEKALQVSHEGVRYIPLIPRARERQLKKCARDLAHACDQFHERLRAGGFPDAAAVALEGAALIRDAYL